MPRTVDEAAHARRRDEFLDAAQGLLQTKGYEQMGIQDVLAEVGTSKGAFYHYFGSKQALMEAVVERMAATIATHLAPVASDPNLPAPDKLTRFFAALAGWKAQRRDLLVALLRVWCSDDNAVVRQKLRPVIAARIAPLLTGIIEQGVGEGVLSTELPEETGRLVVSHIQDLNDRLADLFLEFEKGTTGLAAVERTVTAYTHALERVLGLPSPTLVLVDMAVLRRWFGKRPQRQGASR